MGFNDSRFNERLSRMALSLAALAPGALQTIQAPDPAKKYHVLQDARAGMQAETLRNQQIQENDSQAQAQKAALAKATQVHDILAQSKGQLTPATVDAIFAVDQNAGMAIRKIAADEANVKADNARADADLFNKQIETGANRKHQQTMEGFEQTKITNEQNKPLIVPAGNSVFDRLQNKSIFTAPKEQTPANPPALSRNSDFLYQGQPVVEGLDPSDQAHFGKQFVMTAAGLQDVTGKTTPKPLAPKEPKLAPDLESATSTTRSGLKYVDTSQFTGEARNALTEAANKAGIPAVSKEVGDMLSEIDNARANLDYMNQTIKPFLAKDASGRPLVALGNTIEKLAQTNPDLAAVGTYRSAAIQAMRAVAGAKGLRINRAEIEQAQENDIPKMTDTLPTAQKKLQNMLKFLDNTEKAHIVRDRSGGTKVNIDDILNNVFGKAPVPAKK